MRYQMDAPEGTLAVLVRHGKTQLNESGSAKLRAWLDVPLSNEGKVQVQMTAHKLRFYRPKQVYSSDLQRDMETAQIIAEYLGIPYMNPDFDARTWDVGKFAGQEESAVNERVQEFYKRPWMVPPGSSESFNDFSRRWIAYLEKLLRFAADSDYARPVLIVTHGRNLALAHAHFQGVDPWNADMPLTAGYAEIRVGKDGGVNFEIKSEKEPVLADV